MKYIIILFMLYANICLAQKEDTTSIILHYEIKPSFLNSPYFKQNKGLAEHIISGTLYGVLRPFHDSHKPIRIDIKLLEQAFKAVEWSEIYFRIEENFEYISSINSVIRYIYKPYYKETSLYICYKDTVLGKYPLIEFKENISIDNPQSIWRNPYDFTDQKFIYKALEERLYEGFLVGYRLNRDTIFHKIQSAKDTEALKSKLKYVPELCKKIKYHHKYNADNIKERYREPMYPPKQFCDTTLFTFRNHKLIDSKLENVVLEALLKNHDALSKYEFDLHMERMSFHGDNYDFPEGIYSRFKTFLQEEKISSGVQLRKYTKLWLKSPSFYDLNHSKFIIPEYQDKYVFDTYKMPNGNAYHFYPYLYFSIGKKDDEKIEFAIRLEDLVSRGLQLPDLDKLSLKTYSIIHPITGKEISIKSRKDFQAIEKSLPEGASLPAEFFRQKNNLKTF